MVKKSFKLILLIFLINSIVYKSKCMINNYDVYEHETEEDEEYETQTNHILKLNKIRFSKNFKVECLSNISNFKFDRILFNKSLYNIIDQFNSNKSNDYMLIKSEHFFNYLFQKYDKQWFNNNRILIKNSKFSDSGRYYCVYSNKNKNSIEFLVTSYLYLIYDDVTLVKNYKETVELNPCVDNSNDLINVQWYYNVDNDYISTYMNLNSKTNGLIIKLDDLSLFDIVYQCHNSLNGAFKFYKLECSNCDALLSSPLISPTRQILSEGSDTQFTCEKPANSNEPDRYQWFKQNSEYTPENNNKLNISQSIGYGSILDLKNITTNSAGWYICCLINSDLSPNDRREKIIENNNFFNNDQISFSCSSVELKVIKKLSHDADDTNYLLYTLTVLFFLTILIMAVFIYLCSRKINSFTNADKAIKNMNDNGLYQNKDDFMSSNSSILNSLEINEEELKNLKDMLKSSSSIENLLSEDEQKKWKIPIENLKIGSLIGRGAFGIVLNARLKFTQMKSDTECGIEGYSYIQDSKTEINVAVKKLPENATQKNYYDFFKELKLMNNVGQHKHIVNLIGYSIENSSLLIITDFAKYGNLKDFLRNNSNNITQNQLILYSYQISLGMEYLHSKKILHRDLAARNILVDDYDSIKIADFGLARNIHANYYYVQKLNAKIPLKWMSPESLKYQKVSKESDVWSFGVLLWEIFTYGCTPYPTLQPEQILEKILSGYRMEKPKDCPDYIYESIIKACWEYEPKQRPNFYELVKLFENLIEKPEYLKIKDMLNLNIKQEFLENEDDIVDQIKKIRIKNQSESDCSTINDLKFNLNVPKILTASATSFNPSTSLSTHTTTMSTSTTTSQISSTNFNLDNKNQNLISFDMEPLLNSKNNQNLAYKTSKSMKKNPIYHDNNINKLENNLVKNLSKENTNSNDQNQSSFKKFINFLLTKNPSSKKRVLTDA